VFNYGQGFLNQFYEGVAEFNLRHRFRLHIHQCRLPLGAWGQFSTDLERMPVVIRARAPYVYGAMEGDVGH